MAQVANGNHAAVPISNTLYCSNLPDKLPKDDLKRALYMLFTTHGPVLDIVALKTPKMRGQAHVLFRDSNASTQALRSLQDFDFFGKPMKLQYARTKSDTLAKLDGTYKQPSTASDANVSATQQSIFAGPSGDKMDTAGTSPIAEARPNGITSSTPATKRPREESEDEAEEEAGDEMEMDEEEDD